MNFRGRIDIVFYQGSFQLYMHVTEHCQHNNLISMAIQQYFNRRIGKCFTNYNIIKGFLAMIFTKLYELISVPELLHFEIGIAPDRIFLFPHTDQAKLNALADRRKV
jgi:hypothetical protein